MNINMGNKCYIYNNGLKYANIFISQYHTFFMMGYIPSILSYIYDIYIYVYTWWIYICIIIIMIIMIIIIVIIIIIIIYRNNILAETSNEMVEESMRVEVAEFHQWADGSF